MISKTSLLSAAVGSAALAAPTWKPDSNITDTIIFGISFPSESTGYFAGADNGSGNFVMATTDGGATFNPMPLNDCKPAFMLDVAFESDTSGITSGVGLGSDPSCFTTDGKQMNKAADHVLEATCQSAELVGGGGFGLTGTFGQTDGVSISTDGGKNYKNYDAGFPATLPARYGAFPTASTWFAAGGSFPTNNTLPAGTKSLSHFIHYEGHHPPTFFHLPACPAFSFLFFPCLSFSSHYFSIAGGDVMTKCIFSSYEPLPRELVLVDA